MNNKALTVNEAAEYLGVSVAVVDVWARRGLLPYWQLGPKGWRRFKKADLDRIMETQVKAAA